MATPEVYAHFDILGFDCSPAAITARMGVQPTRSWVRGEISAATRFRPARETAWRLDSALDVTHDIEEHARWLLNRLPPRIDLDDLTTSFLVQMSFAVYVRDERPMLALDAATTARIAALGASVDIDLYVLPPDRDPLEERTPISDEELAAIIDRYRRASPGPWRSMIEARDHTSGSSFIMTVPADARGEDIELTGGTPEDQDFIAHARRDVPRLVQEVKRLRSRLDPGP